MREKKYIAVVDDHSLVRKGHPARSSTCFRIMKYALTQATGRNSSIN